MNEHGVAPKRSMRSRTEERDRVENVSAGASIIRVIERGETMKVSERLAVKSNKSNKMGMDGRMRCHRCGSIMVYEKYYGIEEQFFAWRCICCGDIIDQIILENRGEMAVAPLQL
jgi:hypothetical protein